MCIDSHLKELMKMQLLKALLWMLPLSMRSLLVLACLCMTSGVSSVMAAETVASFGLGDEPTAEETLMLDLINRFRENPAAEIDRVLLGIEAGVSGMGQRLDIERCRDDVAALPATTPLVFNLQLVQSARAHAQYMIHSRITGHYEQAGQPAYTGDTPSQRMRKFNYAGYRMAENAFRNAVSVWNSQRGFIIDWGDGPGGMQDPAGHRLALANPSFREIGCAFVPFDEGRHGSTVHNIGDDKNVGRLIGGVIYHDVNRNARYDIGEGLPGLSLSLDGQERVLGKTWQAGGFRLELPDEQAHSLSISYAGKHYEEQIPAGAENVYLRCHLPQLGDAVYMFKHMTQFKQHLDHMTRPVAINMWLKTRGYYCNAADAALIEKHCAAYAEEFLQDQGVLLPIYYTAKATAFKGVLQVLEKKWVGTDAERFFKDAEKAFAVYADTKDMVDMIRQRKPIRKGRLGETVAKLIKTQKQVQSEELRESLHVLEIMLTRSVAKK